MCDCDLDYKNLLTYNLSYTSILCYVMLLLLFSLFFLSQSIYFVVSFFFTVLPYYIIHCMKWSSYVLCICIDVEMVRYGTLGRYGCWGQERKKRRGREEEEKKEEGKMRKKILIRVELSWIGMNPVVKETL